MSYYLTGTELTNERRTLLSDVRPRCKLLLHDLPERPLEVVLHRAVALSRCACTRA